MVEAAASSNPLIPSKVEGRRSESDILLGNFVLPGIDLAAPWPTAPLAAGSAAGVEANQQVRREAGMGWDGGGASGWAGSWGRAPLT